MFLILMPSQFGNQAAFAQVVPAKANVTIQIGQPMAVVERLLREQGIEFATGGLAVVMASDDTDYITVTLDARQAYAMVSFSKSKQAVVGISLIVHPEDRPQKSYQVWLKAQRITLNADGSYDVRSLPRRN